MPTPPNHDRRQCVPSFSSTCRLSVTSPSSLCLPTTLPSPFFPRRGGCNVTYDTPQPTGPQSARGGHVRVTRCLTPA